MSYSYRKASIGSIAEALRAGTNAADAAAKINNTIAATKSIGLCALPSAHRASSLLNARLSTTPPASPPITLVDVDANTSRNTCAPLAPSAIRIPNSFVLCATLYETTLKSPVAASASARMENPPNIPDTSRP